MSKPSVNDEIFEHTTAITFNESGIDGQILLGANDPGDHQFLVDVFTQYVSEALREIKAAKEPVPDNETVN